MSFGSGGESIEDLNELSVQTAENCLREDLEETYSLVTQLYENIQNDYFLFAKRRMEMILFRLNVLKYYEVSEKTGKADHQLYCLQTDEGAAYREEVIRKLDQSFDKKQGQKLFETGKVLYGEEKYGEAAECFKKAALQGSADGAFWYGDQIAKGEGCEKDEFMASFWFWQASQMDCPAAMVSLGANYYKGTGVWRGMARGLYWFALAALRHEPAAVFNIGVCLEAETVITDNAIMGRTFKRAAEELRYSSRAVSFVDRNAKVILEMMAETLEEREGGV